MSKELIVSALKYGPAASMCQIEFEGGGKVPNELSGVYTARQDALNAIAKYANVELKVEEDKIERDYLKEIASLEKENKDLKDRLSKAIEEAVQLKNKRAPAKKGK